MLCRGLSTLLVVAATTSGCATAPRAYNAVGAEVPSHPIQSSSVVPPNFELTRLPPIQAPDTRSSVVQQASHVPTDSAAPVQSVFEANAPIDELISFALANNPEVQAAKMYARALDARVPQVRALEDPMLMTTTFLEPIQTAAGPQDVILGISQKLPWFGKRTLRGDVAYHQAQAALARIAEAELVVVEQVKLAYYELYFLDRAIEVNRELELRLTEVIEIAKRKFETASERTGLETVLQAQVELSQVQTVFVELEQAKERTYARLARVLHAPAGLSLDLSPSIREGNVPKSADVLVQLIDRCQPTLDALRREMDRDQAAMALASKDYYPDVTLGFNWHAIGPTGLSRVATGDDAFALVAGVNLPVYQNKRHAATREAQFNAARTSQMYDAAWDELRAEVQTLHAQAIEHDRIVNILDNDIVPKAKQTLDLSIDAYRVDRITFQQLIDNYKTLLRYRLDYYRRLSQREQTLATLERAVGCAITTWPIDLEEVPAPPPSAP